MPATHCIVKKPNGFVSNDILRSSDGTPFIKLHKYQVTADGRVISFRRDEIGGKIMSHSANNNGYRRIMLCIQDANGTRYRIRKLIHHLVYFSFHDNYLRYRVCFDIDHRNNNRLDNNLDNLRAVSKRTNQRNRIHAQKNRKHPYLPLNIGYCREHGSNKSYFRASKYTSRSAKTRIRKNFTIHHYGSRELALQAAVEWKRDGTDWAKEEYEESVTPHMPL